MPALSLAQPARPLEQHLPDVLAVQRVLADDVGAQQVHLVRAHGRGAAAAEPFGMDLEEIVARPRRGTVGGFLVGHRSGRPLDAAQVRDLPQPGNARRHRLS